MAAGGSSAAAPAALSDKEAALYDRQIRLWGVEAQQRIRSSRVLLVGVSALGAEITKNLVLAGVNMALADDVVVEPAHVGGQFFLAGDDVGLNRASASIARIRELNELADVSLAHTGPASTLPEEVIAGASVVLACDQDPALAVALAARCRAAGVPILVTASHGFWSTLFVDAGAACTFSVERKEGKKGEEPTTVVASRTLAYPSLADVLALPLSAPCFARAAPEALAWFVLMHAAASGALPAGTAPAAAVALVSAHADALCAAAGVRRERVPAASVSLMAGARGLELTPVAAVMGGVVANDAIKLVTRKDEPLLNVLTFDGMGGTGGTLYSFKA